MSEEKLHFLKSTDIQRNSNAFLIGKGKFVRRRNHFNVSMTKLYMTF